MTVKNLSLDSFVASQLLGDGWIGGQNYLMMSQSEQWEDYLRWKRDLALSIGLDVSEPTRRTIVSNIKEQVLIRCVVKIPNVLSMIRSPLELIQNLDPLGLLLWWLDDGCLVVHEKKNGTSVSRFGYLGTEKYDRETNFKIAETLSYKFNLDCNVHIDKGGIKGKDIVYYRLYLNATNMRAMIDIVRQYVNLVPPSMIYKLNMGYRPTRNRDSAEYMKMYNF